LIVDAEAELDSIREIEPPQGDASTIEAILGLAEEGNELGAEAAQALEEGETSRIGEIATRSEAVKNRATGMAEGYGLKECGQAP
jgi:hypothetical protein